MSRSSTRSKGARKAPAAPAEAPAPGRVQLERMRIADLAPAPYNPRQISEEALAGLGTSVDRFGLVEPVVWSRRTGHVVGGHQRLKVLQARGVTEMDVVVVDLPEGEENALRRPASKARRSVGSDVGSLAVPGCGLPVRLWDGRVDGSTNRWSTPFGADRRNSLTMVPVAASKR